eukprot:COSAG02_NODE_12646_length_1514_cov_3.612721_2_plen_24_part_01
MDSLLYAAEKVMGPAGVGGLERHR